MHGRRSLAAVVSLFLLAGTGCTPTSFTVGGRVEGLAGSGLVLGNGTDRVSVSASGTFTFSQPVKVVTQPTGPGQTCTVSGGTGTVSADVTTVVVHCVTDTFLLGGTVSGLQGGGLVLQTAAGDTVAVTGDGAFTFPTRVASGSAYAVSVRTQPPSPLQACSVTGGAGTVAAADVGSVVVTCAVATFTVGGTASGLLGTMVLQNNLADDLQLGASGPFVFGTAVASGQPYAVTVKSQPTSPSQTCALTGASGTVGSADVTSVALACTTNSFTVGGTVSGLGGTGLVLQDNLGDDLPIPASGRFTFPTPVASGQPYAVTVKTQPAGPSQACVVTSGSGTVGAAAVTTVAVTCTTSTFAVGGTVSGLSGAGLVLQNNAGNDLAVSASGAFTFGTRVPSGGTYAVTVKSQPSTPSQVCTVAAGSGAVTSGDITSVAVTCTTSRFAVRGTVTGLTGTGLSLANGADTLAIPANGAFVFPTLVASGATFAVTVATQPTGPAQTCTVSGGTGTVGSADVASVVVNCATNRYTVGGTVSGLASAVVLTLNGTTDATVSGNGSFSFSTTLVSGAAYAVTVKTQPTSPTQTCAVTSGSGTVQGANVTSVVVTCTTASFTIGGTLSGLGGTGLVLQDNLGDDLPLSANGAFTFSTPVASGATYAVTVKTQPTSPWQTCVVASGSGTVGAASVTGVRVNCTTNFYLIGGTVSGLLGTGLVLQDNGGDDLAVSGNGAFTFTAPVSSGAAYLVTVKTQPGSPWQTCAVASASGQVGGAAITGVTVTCTTNSYTVGGTVTGLSGSGLVLQDNGGNDLAVSASGAFAFSTPLPSGATYAVTVKSQPTSPWQTCAVTSGTGTVAGSNVTSVGVACTTNTYTVGGTVSGLTGTGLVLQDNGGSDLTVSSSGAFTFATPVASGATYAVTVRTQPSGLPAQTCSVSSGGTGTMAGAPVTSVVVSCAIATFTVGGTVSGLAGTGLVLQDNGGDDLTITAGGAFTFATRVASGQPYAVTVKTQPLSASQSCVVASGSGTIAAADVTSVTVTCTTNSFSVGGTVSGLAGSGLVLQDNGGNDLTVTTSGAFTFTTPVLSGAPYAVTVRTQPILPSQTCAVSSGSGTVGNGPVTTVSVTCVTNPYSVGGTVSGLNGTGLVLTNNGGAALAITANGPFTFVPTYNAGTGYSVAVQTQPGSPPQLCTVTSGSGTLTSASVTSVSVACVNTPYAVGGTVTNLAGTGLVLQDNGGDDLAISGNGSFTFPTLVPNGSPYAVTVRTQPTTPWQTCTVTSGSGVVPPGGVTSVAVNCVANTYAVGATVFGMNGTGIVLQNNGGQTTAPLSANGPVAFQGQASGTPYNITVLTQPTNPSQLCTTVHGSGTVGGADVNITVVCSARSCAQRKQFDPSEPDGIHFIDPDGSGPLVPIEVYCDQTTDHGGWTLLSWMGNPFVQGVPYPGLDYCAPPFACTRGSGVPATHVTALLGVSSELGQGESVRLEVPLPATFDLLGSYEYSGKYVYGSLAGVSTVYGPGNCTPATQLAGHYHNLVINGPVDAGAFEDAGVYLDLHLGNYGDYSSDTTDAGLVNSYVWSLGNTEAACASNPTADLPPSSFLGTFGSLQYGPVVKLTQGSFVVYVR